VVPPPVHVVAGLAVVMLRVTIGMTVFHWVSLCGRPEGPARVSLDNSFLDINWSSRRAGRKAMTGLRISNPKVAGSIPARPTKFP